MANETVGIDWIVNLDNFRAEMAKVPGITAKEAKAMTAQLSKEIKAAERAAKAAGDASKNAAKGVDALGEAAGKAGSNSGKLAGFLGMVSPEAASAAQGLADLADVGEVAAGAAGALGVSMTALTPILAALALAAAPVGGALLVMSREADEAAARSAFLSSHLHDLDESARNLEDALLDAAVATGKLSEEQAKLQSIQDAANRAVQDFAVSQEEERKAAEDAYFANQKWLNRLEYLPDVLATAVDHYAGFSSAQQEATWTLDQLDAKSAQHQETIVATAAAQTEGAKADQARADAKDALTKALERERAAFEALQEAADAEAARYARVSGGVQTLIDLTQADEEAQLGKAAKLGATHDAEIRKIGEVAGAALLAARGEEERTAITVAAGEARSAENARYYAELKEYDEELTKKLLDNVKKRTDAERAHNDEVRNKSLETAISVADSIGSISDTISDVFSRNAETLTRTLEEQGAHMTQAEKAEMKKRIEQSKEAALTAYRVQQAAAIAAATVTTAMMTINAYNAGLQAGGPAGLVLGPAMAIVAGAAGAAQIAAIAAQPPPSFHRGLAPDEYSATLKAGEGVLSTQGVAAAGGPDAVRAMNNGQGVGGTFIILNQHRHKIFDAQVRENVKAGGKLGSLLSSARTWRRWRGA